MSNAATAARLSRRSRSSVAATTEGTSQQEVPQGEPKQITISVVELGVSTKSVTGESGMTVGQALDLAGAETEEQTTTVRGQRVEADTPLQDHDVVVVSGQVRGGAKI